jgi:hypothetical protein
LPHSSRDTRLFTGERKRRALTGFYRSLQAAYEDQVLQTETQSCVLSFPDLQNTAEIVCRESIKGDQLWQKTFEFNFVIRYWFSS